MKTLKKLLRQKSIQTRTIEEIEQRVAELRSGTLREAEDKLKISANGQVRKRGGRSKRRTLYPERTKQDRAARRARVQEFLDEHGKRSA